MRKARTALGKGLLTLALAASLLLVWAGLRPRPARETRFVSGNLPVVSVEPVPVKRGEIAVNAADSETLQRLPGIGPAYADAIIREREAHGLFRYPEDLLYVKGIGEKRLAAIEKLLDLSVEEP